MPVFRQIPSLTNIYRDWWLMEGKLVVDWGLGDLDVIEGPIITDGPSIPAWARVVVPWRNILMSGLWHDWKRGLKDATGKPLRSNFAVDGEFLDLIRHEMRVRHGYSKAWAEWTARICYLSVRYGTYTNFSADPPKEIEGKAQRIIQQRNAS